MQNDIGIEICEIETASNVFDSFEMETCIRLRFNCGLSNALWHINRTSHGRFFVDDFLIFGKKNSATALHKVFKEMLCNYQA